MPELPEVETIRRILEPQLLGRTIIGLVVNCPDVIAYPALEVFVRSATGARIDRMGRRGKFISLYLDNGGIILLHLRMTGQLLVTPSDFPEGKHTHLVFPLDDGNELRFIDSRRFGRFWLVAPDEEDGISGVDRLGLEPFDPSLTADYLSTHWGKRRCSIKNCLLEQRVVAGIGNIYGDEILFTSGICPGRLASSLRPAEWEALAVAIPEVLQKGIEGDYMTPMEYLKAQGKEYRNASNFQVYGHGGEPCRRCGAILKRVVIAGRSSCYCPQCQKETPY